jgi:hypothetical protein
LALNCKLILIKYSKISFKNIILFLYNLKKLLHIVNKSSSQAVRDLEPNTHLIGNYEFNKTASQEECYNICDEDFRCAAACFTFPTECRFYKFGFEQLSESVGSTAYIKPEVKSEMSILDKLTDTFPLVKQHTRLNGYYHNFDTLTPSECFRACKKSAKCGGASFTFETKWRYNCFLCRAGEFTEIVDKEDDSSDLWTSYTKSSSLIKSTNSSQSTMSGRKTLKKTRLIGNSYGKQDSASLDECFAKCDEDSKCAAACYSFTVSECHLHKYGFVPLQVPVDPWTAYIKPEVVSETAGSQSRLREDFQTALGSTRYVNFYDSLNTFELHRSVLSSVGRRRIAARLRSPRT